MSNAVTISHDGDSTSGTYTARIDGIARPGVLTWRALGDVRVAEHTFVPPEARGHGVAAKLVEALIADAREQGFRIVPQCSYVAVAFDRHPEWAELRAN